MYDGKTQLLIENPINRYLINSPMLPDLKKNADGSLTLYIQKDSPGKEKESNWLPAPDGPIYVVMRLYWPKEEALRGSGSRRPCSGSSETLVKCLYPWSNMPLLSYCVRQWPGFNVPLPCSRELRAGTSGMCV